MKEGQKFKLIKWNKQLISVATGILLISQLAVGPVQVLAETTDSASPNSSENIDQENQLDVGMSGELFTEEKQNSDGNTGGESQASASKETTRNGASPQIGEVTTEQGLKDAIASASTTGAEPIVLSGTIEISSVIAFSGKDITLTSTDGATLKRVGSYTGGVLTVQYQLISTNITN
ncbi:MULTISPECIES: hypothetical protein [Enterococcus]|uniref:WxL domain-containing protein n=1 Tax=Enterococcus alishanensis TaxID=1303817 RepID=A0ABS6TFR8_9ENTE|nr:hypothetical protein [Enterococcus alishanensis]MBV7391737.1 hypothetical protein [Enterococcus alishanensis]